MKLRNLKKDVLFLAHDLSSIVSVRIFVEGVEPAKFKDSLLKILEFKKKYLVEAAKPEVAVAKPSKNALAKAKRENSAAKINDFVAGKRAYSKAVNAACRKVSAAMLNDYAALSEEISQVK